VILDMVGGDYISRNYEAAAQDGRIVQIAFLSGGKAEVDFRRLMVKRLTHTGSTLRPRSVAEKAVIARALEDKVWPLLAQGRCRPVMDSTFPLDDVVKAHARMDGGEHIGKIILTL
jgi:NADPH2:quinone reductase